MNEEEIFYIARMAYERKYYETCLKYLDECIKINPHNFIYWTRRGTVNYALGRYETALADIDKAIWLTGTNGSKRTESMKNMIIKQLGGIN